MVDRGPPHLQNHRAFNSGFSWFHPAPPYQDLPPSRLRSTPELPLWFFSHGAAQEGLGCKV